MSGMSESCHTYEWVVSRMTDTGCQWRVALAQWASRHVWWNVGSVCVCRAHDWWSWRWRFCAGVCDMAYLFVYMWHDSSICVCVVWSIHMCMCDMTHSHMRRSVIISHSSHVYIYTHVYTQPRLMCDWLWRRWRFCAGICDMTCLYVCMWHDSGICTCVIWLIHMCTWDVTHARIIRGCDWWRRRRRFCDGICGMTIVYVYVWLDSCMCICVIWLIHVCMCDMTHVHIIRGCDWWWRRRRFCASLCGMTHSYVSHDLSMCVTCLVQLCDMTHHVCDVFQSYVWHDSCIQHMSLWSRRQKLRRNVWYYTIICTRATWLMHMHMCDMTHSHVYVWRDTFTHHMNP